MGFTVNKNLTVSERKTDLSRKKIFSDHIGKILTVRRKLAKILTVSSESLIENIWYERSSTISYVVSLYWREKKPRQEESGSNA